MRSKRVLYLVLAVLLVAVAAAGCDVQDEVEEDLNGTQDDAGSEAEELTGSITIAGSTSVQPVSELMAEAFMDMHPKTQVYVQGGGSTAGVRAAEEGAAEIGASSRDLKEEEKHLNEFVLAMDGIAVVVHPSSEINDLTLEQIRNIYAGEITNWSEIDGPDAEIVVVTREEGSGTRGAFEEIVMGDKAISGNAIVQNSTGAVRTTVAGDTNAIGYISLASLSDEVAPVKVEGASCTVDEIISGSYKVARPFIYITKGSPQGLAKEFMDFAAGSAAQNIIEEAGLVSIY